MALHLLTAGRNLPKIRQPREPAPSIISEKTIADFTRVVEQMGILEREPPTDQKAIGFTVAPADYRNIVWLKRPSSPFSDHP